MSRQTKYHTHVEPRLIEIEGWARDGLIDKQIAENLGIAYSTFREYVKTYSALSAALKNGKEVVDRHVENALLKRALGYRYEEVTYEQVSCRPYLDEEGIVREHKLEVSKKVVKEVVPDTTAQIFWLKNRKPQQWRDKQDIEHSGNMNVNNPFEELTTEELRKLIKNE